MKHAIHPYLLFAATLFAACKKDDEGPTSTTDTTPPVLDVSAFSQLNSGNYWVYDRYKVDSLDVIVPGYHMRDSLYVVGDTVLDGNTWSVVRHAVNGVFTTQEHYWRDSADHLLEFPHVALFASATFDQDIYIDSIAVPNNLAIHYAVSSAMVPITVPAGSFDTYVVTGTCYSYGSFPQIPEWKYPRNYWAEGVGRVKWYGYFALGDLGFRYELAHYHVQ